MEPLQKTLDRYIETLGQPTLRSEADLRECIENCRSRNDPNIFYLMVDMNLGAETSWYHNTKRHLGVDYITQNDLIFRIHPHWQDWYLAFSALIYRVGIYHLQGYLNLNLEFSISVPLEHADGSYRWYKQFARPVTCDSSGRIVHFIKEMRLLCAYDRLSPELPKLFVQGKDDDVLRGNIQRAGHEAVMKMLLGVIPRSGMVVLQAYRIFAYQKGDTWCMPDKSTIEKKLKITRAGLNKAITRLNVAARENLPTMVASSMPDLVVFMNDLFGQPAKNEL